MSLRWFHLGPRAFSAQAKVVTSGSRKCLLGQLENCSALRSAFSRGRPARNRVVFINLSGVRRREGKAPENRASLTWPYARVLPAASSHEGRTTPSRRLPLMKTTRFLAGLPIIRKCLPKCAAPRGCEVSARAWLLLVAERGGSLDFCSACAVCGAKRKRRK